MLDRRCFHYLPEAQRRPYAVEVRRILRPGGSMLLRVCLNTAEIPNDIKARTVSEAFDGFAIVEALHADIPSDTRLMSSIVFRLQG